MEFRPARVDEGDGHTLFWAMAAEIARLYDGLVEALSASGAHGARSVLVLSDGRDTSATSLTAAAGGRMGRCG